MRLIGDIHGDFKIYNKIISSVEKSVQVGDFGIGFGKNPPKPLTNNHRFIRGNHDCLDECKTYPNFIVDGTFEDGMMFVGGATSIDKDFRIPGVSWWPDEQLNPYELERMIDIYVDNKPEIMITHEFPDNMIGVLFPNIRIFPDISNTRRAFMEMFLRTGHKPALWVGGHWHMNADIVVDKTRFICLNINSYIDLDTNNIYSGKVFKEI